MIVIGNRPDSEAYIKLKTQACSQVGIKAIDFWLPETVSEVIILNVDLI